LQWQGIKNKNQEGTNTSKKKSRTCNMRYPIDDIGETWWNGFRTSEKPQLVDYVAALHPEA
jgi:hypothetical protein